MKPMTVDGLLASAAENERHGLYTIADQQYKRACWLEQSKRGEAHFIGHSRLPRIYKGSKVTIKKGTIIRGTFPDSQTDGHFANGQRYKLAKRTYTVEVFDLRDGYMQPDWDHKTDGVGVHVRNPELTFVGSGGYWHWVDLNDIPEAVEMAQNDQFRDEADLYEECAPRLSA